jgi:hypothetical protein
MIMNSPKKKKMVKVNEDSKKFVRWVGVKEPASMNSVHQKSLSLSQLKELIEELFQAKQAFDDKCKKNSLPRESMEQFMYSYFKHKFGLNNIVIEWVLAVIESMKIYYKEDNLVALFGLVLRNEIDEEFADIQKQIKMTINDILFSLLESRNPSKGKSEINKLFNDKLNGRISEDLALEIVNTMYTDEHPNKSEIMEKLEEKISESILQISESSMSINHSKKNILNKKKNKKMIKFVSLSKLILDMQLKTHFGFLKYLNKEYRMLDEQNLGYLTVDQFKVLYQKMIPNSSENENEMEELLAMREGYDPNAYTFSDIVLLFSAKKVDIEGETITLLQYIFELGEEDEQDED